VHGYQTKWLYHCAFNRYFFVGHCSPKALEKDNKNNPIPKITIDLLVLIIVC
jgi:hypothetical protein